MKQWWGQVFSDTYHACMLIGSPFKEKSLLTPVKTLSVGLGLFLAQASPSHSRLLGTSASASAALYSVTVSHASRVLDLPAFPAPFPACGATACSEKLIFPGNIALWLSGREVILPP